MKRLGLVLMSVALMLGMAQCKKNVETVSEGIGNQSFTDGIIRLKVNDGGKLAVFPHTGGVYYTEGDVIHVASGGVYKGTLTFHDGYFTNFSGTAPDPGATMYFYYLGGKTPTEDVGGTSLTVNISDQTTGYPVISYGASNETYSEANANYTATLNNVGALVKFDVTSSSSKAATCITGMYNQVSFALSSSSVGTPTPSKADTDGIIKLPAGSGERWAVLLPQSAVVAGQAYTEDSHYYGTRGAVPAIKANDYLSNGISVSISVANTTLGMLNGVFSVSATETVHFSKGNLQYQPSTATWQFAANQFTKLGNVAANKTPSSTMSDWMDLFGWGTSGAGTCYPYNYGNDNSKYAYYNSGTNIAGTEYDWGVNYISNGSSAKTWRTLTYAEWNYLLNTRTGGTAGGTSNARFVKAQVNTDGTAVSGLIIFPDGFNQTTVSGVTDWGTINGTGNSYTATVTSAGWTTLESLGCVFLPAGGSRDGSSVNDDGTGSNYWSTTAHGTTNAQRLYFFWGGMGVNDGSRYGGFSVRLVCE